MRQVLLQTDSTVSELTFFFPEIFFKSFEKKKNLLSLLFQWGSKAGNLAIELRWNNKILFFLFILLRWNTGETFSFWEPIWSWWIICKHKRGHQTWLSANGFPEETGWHDHTYNSLWHYLMGPGTWCVKQKAKEGEKWHGKRWKN